MRYFGEQSSDGTTFCGWQRQVDTATVQGSIERLLSLLLRCPINIVGAGRTDTGVHASFYVAHFDVEAEVDERWLCYKMNILLPPDIAIRRVYRVADDAHARFDAYEREYTYIIEPHKNPFTKAHAWQYSVELNLEAMQRATDRLVGSHDFTSFAKLGSDNKTNICDIRHAEWTLRDDGAMIFTIRADRFLRNMIRALVGTLVDVGRGRYTPEQFADIVESKDLSRSSAGAPARGLFLSDVKYPY